MVRHLNKSKIPVQQALAQGNIDLANQLLGTPYSLHGVVVPGDHLGKSFGFPTANIDFDQEKHIFPARGVYAVLTHVSGTVYQGMANVGIRPTFNETQLKLEVHIFNFNEDIYGMDLTVFFIGRIRDEKKFPSVDALVEQIRKDKLQAEYLFSRPDHPDAYSGNSGCL